MINFIYFFIQFGKYIFEVGEGEKGDYCSSSKKGQFFFDEITIERVANYKNTKR